MSARELRAEARAWRRAARALDREGTVWPLTYAFLYIGASEDVYRSMRTRFYAHWQPRPDGLACMSAAHAVLFCLFLALECEDEANEARALGRGGR